MKVVKKIKVLSSIKRFMKGESVKKVVMSINSLDKDIVKKTYYLTNDKMIVKTYYNNKDLSDITLLQDYAVGYYKHNNQWNKVVA